MLQVVFHARREALVQGLHERLVKSDDSEGLRLMRTMPWSVVGLRLVLSAAAVGVPVALSAACGSFAEAPSLELQEAVLDAAVVETSATVPECDGGGCATEGDGVFVSPKGRATSAGTKLDPVSSVRAAQRLLGQRKRIFLCAGTYDERVVLTGAVSLHGGYSCDTWQRTNAATRIAPKEPGYALSLLNVMLGAEVRDVSIDALAGTPAQRSSVAVFARDSVAAFVRVRVTAHEGVAGANAAAGTNYNVALTPDDAKLVGRDAVGSAGGGKHECTNLCVSGEASTGGAGGAGGPAAGPGAEGRPDGKGGLPGVQNACNPTLQNGAEGTIGDDAPAVVKLGVLDNEGWAPTAGQAGTVGHSGQGGGGGGGATSLLGKGGGGGGGCGGCGGAPAGVAEGGGASIAVLSIDSKLTFLETNLVHDKAGKGGAGSLGQSGQLGGWGGVQTSGGCAGGKGGSGGAGGASGGGAGGISVGVFWRGQPPLLGTGAQIVSGNAAKGLGGLGGKLDNAGPDGVVSSVLEAP
jgi:hypothetical protein